LYVRRAEGIDEFNAGWLNNTFGAAEVTRGQAPAPRTGRARGPSGARMSAGADRHDGRRRTPGVSGAAPLAFGVSELGAFGHRGCAGAASRRAKAAPAGTVGQATGRRARRAGGAGR
jgi:hypothetical protein